MPKSYQVVIHFRKIWNPILKRLPKSCPFNLKFMTILHKSKIKLIWFWLAICATKFVDWYVLKKSREFSQKMEKVKNTFFKYRRICPIPPVWSACQCVTTIASIVLELLLSESIKLFKYWLTFVSPASIRIFLNLKVRIDQ